MEISRLKAELNQGHVSGTYLITGGDALRREEAVRVLEEALCPDEALRQWCLVKVDAEESSGDQVLDLVSTPPILGERRVVVVKGADRLSGDEALLGHVSDPPGFSTLVLVAESYDRRRKLFQEIQRRGRVLAYEAPAGERDRMQRLEEMARGFGLSLDRAALSALLNRVGGDLPRAEQELAKLAAYVAAGQPVGEDAVAAVVADGPPELDQWAVFQYVDALTEGRSAAALEHLALLLEAGEHPLRVLGMIARQFRLLLAGLAWQGQRPEVLARMLALKSTYPAKKALAQARGWTLEQAASALEACAQCDAQLKRGADGRLALELLTVKLAAIRRAPA